MIELEFADGRIFNFYSHAIIPDDRCLLDINRYYLSPLGKLYFKGYTEHYLFGLGGFEVVNSGMLAHIRQLFDLYSKCVSLRIKND